MATLPPGVQRVPVGNPKEQEYLDLLKEAARLPASEFARAQEAIIAKQRADEAMATRRKMYDDLLDAFKYGAEGYNAPTIVREAQTISELIREKIEYHKNIIASLEWFGSHLALDKPEENLFVNRVIMEGLRALSTRNNRESGW